MEEGPSSVSPPPPSPAAATQPPLPPPPAAQTSVETTETSIASQWPAVVTLSQEESKEPEVQKDEPMQIHHPHHFHHQSHSVRASFKKTQQQQQQQAIFQTQSDTEVESVRNSSPSPHSQQLQPTQSVNGDSSSCSNSSSGNDGSGGGKVVVEADVTTKTEEKLQEETSLTTLPLGGTTITIATVSQTPPTPGGARETRRSAAESGSGVSASAAGPSRTHVTSLSEAPTHSGRLKEQLIEIPPTNGHPTPQHRGSKACCFCWCCCCSCSCLNQKNHEKNNARTEAPKMAALTPAVTAPTPKDNNMIDLLNGDNNEPKPTIEDIRMWGESFDKLMRSRAGRKEFREFLRCEYSEENILFWLACEDLKKEQNQKVMEEKARTIYEDYVSILSPKEVSLDSQVRNRIDDATKNPNCHMFDEAQLQIYTLMHRDTYPRFVNSPMYKKLAQFNAASRKESTA
ncbi:hypothetical protein CHUAL_005158 [Chamberlinius hualienensis]